MRGCNFILIYLRRKSTIGKDIPITTSTLLRVESSFYIMYWQCILILIKAYGTLWLAIFYSEPLLTTYLCFL